MRTLKAGYTLDESARRSANAEGRNYWWAYIEEILDRLGPCAEPIPSTDLLRRLDSLTLLFLDGCDASPSAADLEAWVNSGGVLIANNCDCVDDLAGNRFARSVTQPDGDYSIGGELTLNETEFSRGIMHPLHPDSPLLAASALRLVDSVDSTVVAESGGHAAITARKLGDGWVFYFGFDLAQTFWVIQQGRPINRDYDGDGYWRISDAIVTREYEPEIAYTDSLLFVLQNMVSLRPFPLIHRLPPLGDRIPDALLFYGGDDEGSVDIQLPAARFMAEHGLPYHINCMPRQPVSRDFGRAQSQGQEQTQNPETSSFGVGPEEIAELDRLGTELSLHYDFIAGFEHPGGFTQEDVERQTRQFVEHFGRHPVCSVNHCCRWTGSAEPAIWMSEAGVTADNSYFSCPPTSNNPVNGQGFHFGTSYPFHFYADHTRGNERLQFVDLPNTAYEIGYLKDELDTAKLERTFNTAIHYQSTMNFFYHPVYIARYPACREAIVHLLALIDRSGFTIAHSAPDALARWWTARSGIRLSGVAADGNGVSFTASTPPGGAFIATIPLGARQRVRTDRPHRIVEKFGRRWVMVVVDEGESSTEIEFAD